MSNDTQLAPELTFNLADGQNRFFLELAEALVYELHALGGSARITIGELPVPHKGVAHVFLPPHEYVALTSHRPPPEVLRRSILISAEQPQSTFFPANLSLARDAGAVFDINPRSVRAYQSEGIEASLLELGHTSLWDRFDCIGATPHDEGPDRRGGIRERDIDILFLGRLTSRRASALASYAGMFERFRCHLGLSDNSRPNVASGAAFVVGDDKRDLLARAKVLLNVHAEDEPYFEWLRMAEAICAGCAIVTEHSTDVAPLQWGRHILTGRVGSLGLLCAWLVDEDERRDRMRRDAYELLVTRRPLANAARQLLEAASAVNAAPLPAQVVLAARQERARRPRRQHSDVSEHQPLEREDLSDGETLVLRALKNQQLALMAIRRQLDRVERESRGDVSSGLHTRPVAESPAWASGPARALAAIVPLYNHRGDVRDALDSLARSSRPDWEAVVVDDGSTDGGGQVVTAWMESHPHLACLLLRHDLNQGLAAARNTGVAHARADRLLMLDADNEVRRTAIARLMDALDREPGASFAYGIMERFSTDGPRGLLNCYGWDPLRLRISNYIDAFALIRREAISAMEGYSYDQRLYGWEDYDLWVRMAESGRHGVFVPEIIARYRVGHSSMISHTNVSTADAYAALIDHAPKLMAGLQIPR